MLNLTLFEIQRKWKTNLLALLLYEIANGALVYKIYPTVAAEGTQTPAIAFLFLFAMILPIMALFEAVNSLRLEAKHTSRDLYFALPYSGFEKIGSKMLISFITMAFALGISMLTALASVQYLTGNTVMNQLLEGVLKNPLDVCYAAGITLTHYMVFIAMAYLSFALFRSFFSQVKFGGAATFGIFLAVAYGLEKITEPLTHIWMNSSNTVLPGEVSLFPTNAPVFILQIVVFIVLFTLTSWLFEHRANFD